MPGFKDIVRDRLKKFLQVDPARTTERSAEDMPDDINRLMGKMRGAYFDSLTEATKRTKKYEEFKYLDKNLAEASSTLNIYSDNIVSGAIGGAENYKVVIDESAHAADKATEVVKETEKRTGIKDDVWDIARDMICFGDDWEEIVVEERNKKFGVKKLKSLPIKEMYADVNEHGAFKDEDIPYIQKDFASDSKGISFEKWRIVHFKVGRGIYGVDRSIFSNSSRRVGRQLLWIDDAMVVARLSRAYQRLAFMVDTSNLNAEDKFRFAEKFLDRIRRHNIVDRTTGRVSPLDTPWFVDEDIAIPVEKDSPQGVKLITSDYNVSRIEDVRYFQEKFFMALNMPKAYASQEQGVRAKATITQLDVQFARQVRRKQSMLRPGLRRIYETAFWLADIDPDSFVWNVVFPVLATMDEMLKWNMEKVKAEIAKFYTVDMGVMNSLWVYEKLMGFNKEEIGKYALVKPEEMGETYTNISPETAALIRRDPYLRTVLDDLKDLASWQLSREKEMEGKKVVDEVEREEELSDKWRE